METSEINNESRRLFKNTQEAVQFGETASQEDMSDLMKKTFDVTMAYMMDMSFEMQFYNEAYHAFKKDDWYRMYQKTSDGKS